MGTRNETCIGLCFVAATWQITIVAGALLTPLFGKRIPIKNLICSVIILGGILLLQVSHFKNIHIEGLVTALLLIIVAGMVLNSFLR